MDSFLDTQKLVKLSDGDKENFNISISKMKIDPVIKMLPIRKSSGLDGFMVQNSTKLLRKKKYLTIIKLLK